MNNTPLSSFFIKVGIELHPYPRRQSLWLELTAYPVPVHGSLQRETNETLRGCGRLSFRYSIADAPQDNIWVVSSGHV